MKKLVLIVMAVVSMMFTACGGATTTANDSDSVAVDTLDSVAVADTLVVDSIVAE